MLSTYGMSLVQLEGVLHTLYQILRYTHTYKYNKCHFPQEVVFQTSPWFLYRSKSITNLLSQKLIQITQFSSQIQVQDSKLLHIRGSNAFTHETSILG